MKAKTPTKIREIRPINYDKLDPSLITYSNASKRGEAKACDIYYSYTYGDSNVKAELNFKTPETTSKYGVSFSSIHNGKSTFSQVKPNRVNYKKHKFSIEVNVDPNDAGLVDFYNKLVDIDHSNASFIAKNAKTWWGDQVKQHTAEQIMDASIYESVIKRPKGSDNEIIKLKLLFTKDGYPRFDVFDQDNNIIPWVKKYRKEDDIGDVDEDNEIPENAPLLDWDMWNSRNMNLEVIIKGESLWIINKKVYCTFVVSHIKVYPKYVINSNPFSNTNTLDDEKDTSNEEEEEEEEEENVEYIKDEVEDDNDEEDEDDE